MNMKKRLLFTCLLIVILASCTKDNLPTSEDKTPIQKTPLTGEQVNKVIDKFISETGSFDWKQVDDYTLWSAALLCEGKVTVGYGSTPFAEKRNSELVDLKNRLVTLTIDGEKTIDPNVKSQNIVLKDDAILNNFNVKITNYETIKSLRKMSSVRYVEPAGYNYFAYKSMIKSDSGCSTSPDAVNSADYRTIAPNCLVSWVFDKHNIPSAWQYSTGAGITVGLIDTGVSNYQELLGSSFNDGYSSGRSISKYGVYIDSIWPWVTTYDGYHDKCGHGTSMAGTISSPRNDNNMPVGVAYNCNFVSYRGTWDVVLDGYQEQDGVTRALTGLANNSNVRVISMSIGWIFSVGSISDGIKYAYSKGKLIFCAGGTSTEFTNFVGVIFPASMAEAVAVTGVTDASTLTECAVCHKGSKIDFVVIMQRASSSSRTSVVCGYNSNTIDYVGGSSVSTATTAGIAALVWSRYPSWTRDQVLTRLKQSAKLYPNRDANFGYGPIDALKAVL